MSTIVDRNTPPIVVTVGIQGPRGIQGEPGGGGGGSITSVVGITGTKAQFDTAVTDGNILYVGDSIASTAISDSTTAGRSFLTAATAAAQRTLLNVADGATANTSDADLRDRATHTGTQAVATITGLGTAATTAATAYATAAQGTLAGTATQPADIALMVESDVTGVTGADAVTNIISLTQAEYDDIVTPNASTIYLITDA